MQQSHGVERDWQVAVVKRGRWTVFSIEVAGLDRSTRDLLRRTLEGFVAALRSRLERGRA